MTNKNIITNSLYTIFEKIIVMLISFFATVIVVRYLGPSDFGLLSYAFSIVAVASAFTKFGLNSLMIKMFSEKPDNIDELFISSLFIKLISSLLVVIILGIFFFIYEKNIFPLVIIALLVLIIESFEGIKFLYQAKLLAKYITYAGILSTIVATILKVIFVYFNASLIGFGAIYTFSIFLGIVFLYFFQKKSNLNVSIFQFKKSFNFEKIKILLVSAFPLYIAGIATAIFMKADQLMLQWLTDSYQVGIYSVAVTLASALNFIPVAISASFLPILTKLKTNSTNEYNEKTQLFADSMIIIVLPIVIIFFLFSNFIIESLYGIQFHESAKILSLYIIILIFIAFEGIVSNLLIIENLQKYMMLSYGLGAILNILFNLFLIPKMQAEGAVYATLLSYIISHYIFYFIFSETRKITIIQTKALINIFNIKTYKNMFNFYNSRG